MALAMDPGEHGADISSLQCERKGAHLIAKEGVPGLHDDDQAQPDGEQRQFEPSIAGGIGVADPGRRSPKPCHCVIQVRANAPRAETENHSLLNAA